MSYPQKCLPLSNLQHNMAEYTEVESIPPNFPSFKKLKLESKYFKCNSVSNVH